MCLPWAWVVKPLLMFYKNYSQKYQLNNKLDTKYFKIGSLNIPNLILPQIKRMNFLPQKREIF